MSDRSDGSDRSDLNVVGEKMKNPANLAIDGISVGLRFKMDLNQRPPD